MDLHTIGIDLVRQFFIWSGLTCAARSVVRKKFSRTQLLRFVHTYTSDLIGMEACGSAHLSWSRALREQGHEVRLIPAQYMKPT